MEVFKKSPEYAEMKTIFESILKYRGRRRKIYINQLEAHFCQTMYKINMQSCDNMTELMTKNRKQYRELAKLNTTVTFLEDRIIELKNKLEKVPDKLTGSLRTSSAF